MKFIKYTLYAIVGLVVLVVGAIAFAVATFDPNKYKAELAQVVKEKTGRTLSIEGNIGLSFYPSIGVAVGKTSLSERNSEKTFARIDDVKVSLALLPLLSKQVVVDRVTLSGLNVDLVQGKDGKTNFADLAGAGGPPARAPSPSAKQAPKGEAPQLDIAGIEVRASSVGWHDEATGARYKATIEEFKTGRIASGVPGKLALAARVEASEPKADYQVRLSGDYRLNFEKETFALSGLDLNVSDATPGSKAPPLSLKGDVEFDASPQAIRFNLAADQVNLDRYLPPPAKGAAGGGAAPAPAAPAPEQPIDLSGLKGLNLKGDLKIEQLIASNVKLEKVNLGVKAAGGKVDAEPLTAELYQGKLTGAASVNANSDRFTLKAELGGVALGPLLKDALNNDMLEGKGNVALDVQTGGNTVSALKKALAGNANVSLKDGALKGINLDNVIRKKMPSAQSSSQRTDLSELTASFVIKNGVAHNDDLAAKTPLLQISGAGDVDIGSGTIDYVAKSSGVAVKISGPLDSPRFSVDLKAAAAAAAKQQIQKQEDKLKERGKDLLKRLLK